MLACSAVKVLIADKFAESSLGALRDLDIEVDYQPELTATSLAESVSAVQPDVLVVRSTRVDANAIEAANALKLIIRAGAGYDTIDVARASASGVFVANCPGKNAIAVAELTLALILSCDRRVPDQVDALRAGRWNKKEFAKAQGLCGRTLGLVGLGTIGVEVASRARAFGLRVIAWSRSLTPEMAQRFEVERVESLAALAEQSDIVSVHVASTPQTRHLIDDAFVDAMRPGAIFVNTSRGAVVSETALARGIDTKRIRAGLDVYESEPTAPVGEFNSTIARQHGVYGTHHIGASTAQAQEAIGNEAVRIVAEYARTKNVPNCVNRADKSAATCMLTVRHRNRPGVLAKVFDVLSQAHINVEEMENLLYEGQEAACARIQLAQLPGIAHMAAIRDVCDDILSLEVSELHSGDNA